MSDSTCCDVQSESLELSLKASFCQHTARCSAVLNDKDPFVQDEVMLILLELMLIVLNCSGKPNPPNPRLSISDCLKRES